MLDGFWKDSWDYGVDRPYLFAITVLTVTELEVIFKHAGMGRDRDTVQLKIIPNNLILAHK